VLSWLFLYFSLAFVFFFWQVDPELSKVDLLEWLGDLNYRLVDLTQEEAGEGHV